MLTAAGKAVQRNVAGRAVQRNVAATRMTPVSLKGPAQGGKGLTLFEKWGASPASIAKRQEAGAVQAQQKLAQQVAAGLSAPDKEVALVLDELICVLEENEEIKLHRQLDSELGDSDFSLVDHYNPSKRTRITSRPLVDYYRGSMAEVASGRWSLAEADMQKLARKAAVAELRASQLPPKKQKAAGRDYIRQPFEKQTTETWMRKAAAIYLFLTVGRGKWEETLKYIPGFALRTTATHWTSFTQKGIRFMKSWVQLVCAMQWSSVKALLPEYKNSLSKLAWDETLMVPEATLAKYMPHAGRKAALFKMPAATMPDTDGAGALPTSVPLATAPPSTVPLTAAPDCTSNLILPPPLLLHHWRRAGLLRKDGRHDASQTRGCPRQRRVERARIADRAGRAGKDHERVQSDARTDQRPARSPGARERGCDAAEHARFWGPARCTHP